LKGTVKTIPDQQAQNIPLWDEDIMEEDELAFAHNLYGRGIPNVNGSKFSSQSRVTFVRTGSHI
jgi:hypothetical protein